MTSRSAGLCLASMLCLGCSSGAATNDREGGGASGGTAPITSLECPENELQLLDNSVCLLETADADSPRCSYPGSGCPHVYECVPTVNSPADNGGWWGSWTPQPPMPGDACDESGTVCDYSHGTCYEGCYTGSTHYTCTDAHEWVLSLTEECTSCSCCEPCPTTAPSAGTPCEPSYAMVLTCTYRDSNTGCATQAACNEGSWVVEPSCP